MDMVILDAPPQMEAPPSLYQWITHPQSATGGGVTQPRWALRELASTAGRVVGIAASVVSVVVRTARGQLWSWAAPGADGDHHSYASTRAPSRPIALAGVTVLSASLGAESLLLLVAEESGAATGSVLHWPSDAPSPRRMLSLESKRVDSIACGAEHCLACCSMDGCVYGWGAGDLGQLGLDDFDEREQPTLLPLDKLYVRARGVACGPTYSIVLLAAGSANKAGDGGSSGGSSGSSSGSGGLLSCGDNTYGALGRACVDPDAGCCCELRPVEMPMHIGAVSSVSCGASHALALSEATGGLPSVVVSWGSAEDGLLGRRQQRGVSDEQHTRPREMDALLGATLVSASEYNSVALAPAHPKSASSLDQHALWIWGQVGYQTHEVPVRVLGEQLTEDARWLHVAASSYTTFALASPSNHPR